MKRNATFRIVLYSIVIILLLGILAAGIGSNWLIPGRSGSAGNDTLGSGSADPEQIRNIEIDWAAGNITIEAADTDSIAFHETGDSNAEPMVFRQNGSKLIISYSKQKIFSGFTADSKDLVITVPAEWVCSELSVDAASANLSVKALTISETDLDMASGNCDFEDCSINELSIDCASGEVRYNGTLTSLDCDTASGSVTANLKNIPRSIDFDGASADLDLTLPADAGFQVNLDSISGDFSSDFETSKQGKQITCGDGACRIEVDGVAGNITIRKG